MSKESFYLIQIILAVLLIILVLLQVKGAGIGSTFGESFNLYQTRRGVEKMIFYLTIIIAGLFLVASVTRLLI